MAPFKIRLGSAARTVPDVVRAVSFNKSDKGDCHFGNAQSRGAQLIQVTVTSFIGRKRVVMSLKARRLVLILDFSVMWTIKATLPHYRSIAGKT